MKNKLLAHLLPFAKIRGHSLSKFAYISVKRVFQLNRIIHTNRLHKIYYVKAPAMAMATENSILNTENIRLNGFNLQSRTNKIALGLIGFLILAPIFSQLKDNLLLKSQSHAEVYDLKLYPAPKNSQYLYQNTVNGFKVYLGNRAQESSPRVRFEENESSAEFSLAELPNADTKFEKKDDKTVVYRNIQPGIDLQYSLTEKGVKEEIIINHQSSIINHQFKFALSLKNAIPRQSLEGEETTYFIEPIDGQYRFHIPKPYMVDAAGNRSEAVELKINQLSTFDNNGGQSVYTIIITPDPQWLALAVYPVTIDPSVVHDESSEFTGTTNRIEDEGSGTSPKLRTPYHELPADEHTVGLWHINETANDSCSGGEDACDSSGNVYHGTATGTTIETTNQKLGAAARSFDGSDDKIYMGDVIDMNYSNLTIEVWIKTISNDYGYLVAKAYDSPFYAIYIHSTGQAVAVLANASTSTSSYSNTIVNDNSWHHIAAVWDRSGSQHVYIDGVEEDSDSISADSGVNIANANNLTIGANCNSGLTCGNYLNAYFDEVRISNVARTAEEIKQDAQRFPYGVYTSDTIDLTSGNGTVASLDSLEWTDNVSTPGATLDGYPYFKPVIIDNTQNANTLTNYQTKVNVDYDSNMQSDFDDLRFTSHTQGVSAYGSEATFNSDLTSDTVVAALDSTHSVVVYRDSGGDTYGHAKVGTVSGSTISYGNEYTFNSADTDDFFVATLDSTHFVVAYRDTGGDANSHAKIGTVSGSTISYGNEYTFNSACISNTVVAALNSTHFVVGYKYCTGYEYGHTKIGSVSGTTITYGSEYTFNSANTNEISVATLDSTHFVVGYTDQAYFNGHAKVGTVSGTAISYGAEATFNSASTGDIFVAVLNSTHFVVAYRDSGGDTYGHAKIGTVSGTTITYGSEYTFNSADTDYNSLATLDSTHFVVGYKDDGGDNYGHAKIGAVTGSTISYGDEATFNSADTYGLSVSALESTLFIVGYRNYVGDTSGHAKVGTVVNTNLDYWIETKSDGVEATVWVEVDTIPASSLTTIWMWYGNGGASAGSNGANTFVFFDDFNDASLNGTLWNSAGTVSESGGVVTITNSGSYIGSKTSYGVNYSLRYRGNHPNVESNWVGFISGSNTPFAIFERYATSQWNARSYVSAETITALSTSLLGAYHQYEIERNNGSSNIYYVNDGSSGSGIHTTQVTSNSLPLTAYMNGTGSLYLDWIALRSFTSIEPITGVGADIEFQTRTGSTSSPPNGWEAWKPTTNETQIENLDKNDENESETVFDWTVDNISNNQTWIKSNNTKPANSDSSSTDGRIPLGTDTKGDDYAVSRAAVIKDGSSYKMWYSGQDGVYYRIYYATSPDGLTWTKYNNAIPSNSDSSSTDGRIPLGTDTKGDDYHTMAGSVMKDGSTYKMWYSGYDGTYYRIYYATSPDGLTWTKYNNAIPSNSNSSSTDGRIPLGTDTKGDDGGTRRPAVIKDGPTYKMWYSGSDGTYWRTYYATSSDGLTWTKYNNAIPSNSDSSSTDGRIPLGSSGKGDETGASSPSVIKDGSTYKMWYAGTDNVSSYGRTFYATSSDGLTWTKLNNTSPNTYPNPSESPTTDGRMAQGILLKGDDWNATEPYVIKEGGVYKNWYSGWQDVGRIYYATMTPQPIGDNTESTIKMEGDGSLIATVGAQLVDASTRGLWHLEETSGTGAYLQDETTNNNDGTPTGTTVAEGFFGKARSFNGSSDYINTPTISIPTNITAEVWVYSDNYGSNMFVVQKAPVNTQWELFFESGSLKWRGGSTTSVNCTAPSNNQWHHVVGVQSGTTAWVYIDGTQCNTGAVTAIGNGTGTIDIGRHDGPGYYFSGLIDEVRISSVARTSEEIAEAYRAGRDHRISRTIGSQDLSAKSKIPFYFAADKQGTIAETYVGETDQAIYRTDSNTKGLWHLDDTGQGNENIRFDSTNVAGTAYTYWKTLDDATTVATNDIFEYDVYLINNLGAVGGIDIRFTDTTYARSVAWTDQNSLSCHPGTDIKSYAYGKWYHRKCTIPAGMNGKVIDWIDVVNEVDTATAITAYYDNFIIKNSSGTIKSTIHSSGTPDYNVVDFLSNASNTGNATFNISQTGAGDESGNFNESISFGGTSFTQGKIGGARYFDGTDDYFSINDVPGSTFQNNFTVEAWVKFNSVNKGTDNAILGHGAASANNGLHLCERSGKAFFGFYSNDLAGNATLSANEWYHLAFVYDGGKKIYVNGVLDNSGTSNVYASSLTNAEIGRIPWGTTSLMSGVIDEVRISNTNRSADEIRLAYQYGIRTHQITADYVTTAGPGGIASTSDHQFMPETTTGLYEGDTTIVRENYNGTNYIMQGEVTSISSGWVTVSSWSGTAPSGGYSSNADVFKWQREYWDLKDISPADRNTTVRLGLRVLDASEGFTMYLDDFRHNTNYLTDNTGSTITSTANRYIQYRAILSTNNTQVTPELTSVTLDYNLKPTAPTNLLTNDLTNPDNVTDTTPYFSAIFNDESDLANKYRIQVDDDSGFGSTLWDSGSSGTAMANCTDGDRCEDITYGGTSTDLQWGIKYYWRIKYWDDQGVEGDWNTEEAYFIMATFYRPTVCIIDDGSQPGELTVKWEDNTGLETGYRIEKKTDSGDFTLLATDPANTISRLDDTTSAEHTYQYRIRGESNNGNSEWCTTAPVDFSTGSFRFEGVQMEGVKIE